MTTYKSDVPALPAEPPLGPVAAVALPDEGRGGPAPGTGIGGRIARHPAELPRDRHLRRIDELALLLEGEPLHLMEYDIQHPVPVSSMSMFGDIHLRAGAGHYCVNGGLTETGEMITPTDVAIPAIACSISSAIPTANTLPVYTFCLQ